MNEQELTPETRSELKHVSRAMIRLHKLLLDREKLTYEAAHGPISNPHEYLSLVLDHPHFAWLRKISSLIALIDEAASVRRPSTESEAKALFADVKRLLNFENDDEDFNDKFQNALQQSPDAVLVNNDVIKLVNSK